MAVLQAGWSLDVERGPDWLFVRLQLPANGECEGIDVAEAIWQLMQQHMVHRVVVEMHGVRSLRSWLIGQLVLLHKRVVSGGGLMRLCGLSNDNHRVLHMARLDERFPQYTDRGSAVMGHRPPQPR